MHAQSKEKILYCFIFRDVHLVGQSSEVCLFARAAVTKRPRLYSLNNRNFLRLVEARSPRSRCVQVISSEASLLCLQMAIFSVSSHGHPSVCVV